MSERGRLEVEMTGNQSGFRQMLNSARQNVKAFAGEVGADMGKSYSGFGKGIVGGIAGFFGFEAIKSAFDSFIDRTSQIKDMSEQMEMGAEATQKWQKAADRLGLSFGGMQGVLMAVQQKRIDAATDRKAANIFQQLGISRRDVLDLGGLNASDFALKTLLAGGQSEESKALLADIVGRRGIKFAGAAKEFGAMTADFDEQAIAAGDAADKAWKKFLALPGRVIGAIISDWQKGIDDIKSRGRYAIFGDAINRGLDKAFGGRDPAMGGYVSPETKGTPPGSEPDTKASPDDPLAYAELEAEDKKDQEAKGRIFEQLERLHESQRQNMTAGNRRMANQDRLKEINERIKYYDSAEGMLSPEDNLKRTQLLTEREGIISDLREKPIHLAADSLSKSGLFTGSGLNFSMDGSTQKQQLSELRGIRRALEKVKDPHTL